MREAWPNAPKAPSNVHNGLLKPEIGRPGVAKIGSRGGGGAYHGSARQAALRESGSCGPCIGVTVGGSVWSDRAELLRPRVEPAARRGTSGAGQDDGRAEADSAAERRGAGADAPAACGVSFGLGSPRGGRRVPLGGRHAAGRDRRGARRGALRRGARPTRRDDSRVEADGVAERRGARGDGRPACGVSFGLGSPRGGRRVPLGGRHAVGRDRRGAQRGALLRGARPARRDDSRVEADADARGRGRRRQGRGRRRCA